MSWFKSNFRSNDKISITVEGVNPQTENEFRFFNFVEREQVFFLEKWFEQSKKLGHQFKPQYSDAIVQKIRTGTFSNPHSFPEYFNSEFDFIAIDFETANNNRVSACALGLAFVKNDTFVHEEKHFILPPPGEKILSSHERLHGIQEEDLEFALDFKELWDLEFSKYFNNNLIVIHNSSMDLSVLKSLFSHYKIENYSIDYIDTMRLAEISGKPKKLTELANLFEVPIIKHHDPKEDAKACATIFTELKELVPNYRDLIQILNPNLIAEKQFSRAGRLKIQNDNLDIISEYSISKKELEDLQIEGSAFLFTGELTEDREDCKDFIMGYGGLIKSTITSKVDYVVVGAEYGWSKIQKIHLLNSERNLRIRLLSNADYLRLKERYEKLNF